MPLIQQLELRDAKKAFPSFVTIFLMPLLYSIDKAIFAGLAAHIIMHLLEVRNNLLNTFKYPINY